ncbi:MAG: dihydrolipoyl dehydrogenase [candidate division Zixibacteria bacterium]|nr:dihydrolipoyl dehydrogenase [candidate division Zixibacteria bacterium]
MPGVVIIDKYDIVIIGGGPGGYTAAIRAALKGAKVAVVENDKLGGVCLNRGCIPSKALIASAIQYKKAKEAATYGINLTSPPTCDWGAMRARKDKIVAGLVGGIGQLFKSHGVDHYQGFGRIVSANEIAVIDRAGVETRLAADNIIVATGSRSADLPGIPIDGQQVVTSDHMFELEKLPSSILIIGAGVIGCEWAFMLSHLDVKVTIVEMLDHALPMEDENSSKLIERELKKLKVGLNLGSRVESLAVEKTGVTTTLTGGKTVEAEQVLVSVGRAFNTGDIGLEKAGVELNENGSIKVGPDCRTAAPHIFAIGDVAGESLLAYTAVHDGTVAVDNALGGAAEKNYTCVPSVIFTHPEVASVGLTQKKAAERYDVGIGKYPLRALGKAHAENEIAGEVMVIGDRKTDKLLGVHMVGAHATEIIHTAALSIDRGLTVTELGSLTFAHPVISEALMEAAHDFHSMSIHLARKR